MSQGSKKALIVRFQELSMEYQDRCEDISQTKLLLIAKGFTEAEAQQKMLTMSKKEKVKLCVKANYIRQILDKDAGESKKSKVSAKKIINDHRREYVNEIESKSDEEISNLEDSSNSIDYKSLASSLKVFSEQVDCIRNQFTKLEKFINENKKNELDAIQKTIHDQRKKMNAIIAVYYQELSKHFTLTANEVKSNIESDIDFDKFDKKAKSFFYAIKTNSNMNNDFIDNINTCASTLETLTRSAINMQIALKGIIVNDNEIKNQNPSIKEIADYGGINTLAIKEAESMYNKITEQSLISGEIVDVFDPEGQAG